MIPLKLSLKNFMCYRDNVPPLSFEGIHVACLCGDNGSGKSTIFDAMTWALWGKSRAKSDGDLIFLGQSDMEVDLEFSVRSDRYRVVRKLMGKTVSKTGQSVLDLQIQGSSGFKSVSGNNITETQEKIIGLLHLDYETFINSVFLRQGHSNEFTIKPPAKRKEILAEILGLSDYEVLEDRAKRLVERKKNEGDILNVAISAAAEQLQKRPQYDTELQLKENALSKIENEKKICEVEIAGLRQKKEKLEIKKQHLASIQEKIDDAGKRLHDLNGKLKTSRDALVRFNALSEQKATIEQGYLDFTNARKSNDELSARLGKLFSLRKSKEPLEKAISAAEQKLQLEYQRINEKIKLNQEKTGKKMAIENELAVVSERIQEITSLENKVNESKQKLNLMLADISRLKSERERLVSDIAEDTEKLNLLGEDESKCPLCNKELTADEREKLRKQFAQEINKKQEKRTYLEKEITDTEKEKRTLGIEITQSESDLKKERDKCQARVAVLQKQGDELKEAETELAAASSVINDMAEKLKSRKFAEQEQAALNKLSIQEEQLAYDEQQHERVKSRLIELQKFELLKKQLDGVERNIQEETAKISDFEKQISELDVSLQSNTRLFNTLSQEIRSLSPAVAELIRKEESFQSILKDETKTKSEIAVLQERLRSLDELEESKREQEARLQQAKMEEAIYKELAEAFGKKGVQAMLISQSFPEIEIEANRLLSKMTDNRLSLTLESQRQAKSKKGEPIETLDIKISDETGTRDYEMFSGGEGFRIDLALRIAISKLLVRRAGASLPILIIDEGFGTQDSTGRERLVEAIKSIENDFEKIFVITHLEELKDSFPVTISVVKTGSGSTIQVN
jgi:DNA repair protein SbcC/Rad50